MKLSDYDFDLPEALIATRPARPRTAARLLLATGDEATDNATAPLDPGRVDIEPDQAGQRLDGRVPRTARRRPTEQSWRGNPFRRRGGLAGTRGALSAVVVA